MHARCTWRYYFLPSEQCSKGLGFGVKDRRVNLVPLSLAIIIYIELCEFALIPNMSRWFRRWKLHKKRFRRWKINLVKSHRDDSEGEKSISWKFTEMIPKEKIFIEIIPKGKNWHQSQFRWNSGSQLISKVKNLKRWSSLEIWVDDPNYIRKSKRPLDIECQQRRRARRSHWCISMTKKWRTRGWSNRRNSLMEWLKR
jgi:hypothetical protein